MKGTKILAIYFAASFGTIIGLVCVGIIIENEQRKHKEQREHDDAIIARRERLLTNSGKGLR